MELVYKNSLVAPGTTKRRVAAALIGMMMSLSGCLEQAKQEENACEEPINKTIAAVDIKNNAQILFSLDDLAFLSDPNTRIDSVMLEGQVVKHHTRLDEFSFSLNGIKASRKDGGPGLEIDCTVPSGPESKSKSKDDDNSQRAFCSRVHKFYLNGGLGFALFLAQVKKNQGELRLGVHGRDSKVVEARLVINGVTYKTCEEPPPPPPPPAVAPDTNVVSADPAVSPTALTSMSIAFSSDQSGVGFFCSLDGGAYSACSSPAAFSNLSSGAHLFKVYAQSAAGLADASPAEYAWTVDAVSPSVVIDNLASLPVLTASGTISFQFSSNEPGSFKCSIDGAALEDCSSPESYAGLGEGNHKFEVYSVDSVGNQSAVPASHQWVIDQTAPVSQIVSADPGASINNSSSMSIQFAANESGGFECSVDNGPFQACVSPVSMNSLSEGSHWFEVRATDPAGNQGLPASYNWLTDYSAPVIDLGNILPDEGMSGAHNISVEFSLSEAGSAFCSFDGAAPSACASPFTAVVDAAGAHALVITAKDVAGNEAVAQSLSWDMDFSSPQISFGEILPSSASFINSADMSFEVISSEQVVLHASLDGVDIGAVGSPIQLNGLPEGAHVFEVSATDLVGNPGNTISHGFNVDLTAPQLSLSAQITGQTRFDSNVLTFSADEAATFQCNADGAGFAACASPLELSGLAEGDHSVEVRAVDMAGNVSATASASWSVDTVAPLTSLIATQTSANSYSFALASTEANSSFLCSLDGAMASVCTSPAAYSNLIPGQHIFSAWAVDAAGNMDPVGASYNFSIASPITTMLTAVNPSGAYINVRDITFEFSANQAGATFVCSLNGAAYSPCSSPFTYTNLADATYNFTVKAVDSFGTVDPSGATHSWAVDTVAPTGTNPSITVTSTSIKVTWTTNEPATTKLFWGVNNPPTTALGAGAETSTFVTSHQVILTGLTANTVYNVRPSGTDRAGNVFLGNVITVRTNR
jgi:large repetitive protein